MTSRRYWSVAGSGAAVTATVLLIWNAWNRSAAEPDNAEAVRIRVLKTIVEKLSDTHQWRTNFPNGPEFDRWLAGMRDDFRPYFSVLSTEFDSRLLFITLEFGAYADDSGPLRDHSRQLALVSTRELLEDERSRLENRSLSSDDIEKRSAKRIRLPFSMLMDGR